jgi:E3 ubiquitin-protein ligase HUWE1
MDTGGQPRPGPDASATDTAAETPTQPPEPPLVVPEDDDMGGLLPDLIANTARMLDSLLSNADMVRIFLERGGLQLLLQMYSLPRVLPTFGSHAVMHAVVGVVRSFMNQHANAISPTVYLAASHSVQVCVGRGGC